MKRIKLSEFIFGLLGSIIIILIILPIAKLLLSTPVSELIRTAMEEEVLESVLRTLTSALWATFIACLSGIPLAYILARKNFRGKSLISALVDLPIVIPHTSAGIALLLVFGKGYTLGKLFDLLGVHIVGAVPGIVIAMIFVSAPFLVNYARAGFEAIDPEMEDTARVLGAGALQVFFRVSLPLAKRSIITGMLMMWARGISEFGAVVILAYHPMVAPVLVYERFETYGLDSAKSVALIIVIICLIFFITGRGLLWRKKNVAN